MNKIENEIKDITNEIKNSSKEKCENDITVKNWTRNCPKCQKELTYKYKHSRDNSETNNRLCWSCRNSGENNPFYGKTHTEEHKKHISVVTLNRDPELVRHIAEKRRGKIMSESAKQKLSVAAIRQFSTDDSRKANAERLRKFYENNPDARIRASELTKQKYEEYRETDEYKEWQSKKSEYDLYRLEVSRLTFENDLSKLENWSKRNLYHLYEIDHIYPIRQAFKNSIPAELIGDINNLRIIPRKENRSKSGKITIIPEHIQSFFGERL